MRPYPSALERKNLVSEGGPNDYVWLWSPPCQSTQHSQQGQQERQNADVAGRLDVILGTPENRVYGLTEVVPAGRDPASRDDVEITVMGGVAKEVGKDEGNQLPPGEGPADHLLIAGRALAEVDTGQFVEGDQLHGGQRDPQQHHGHQSGGQADQMPEGYAPSPEGRQSPQGVESRHEQDVVRDLDVASEKLDTHDQAA